LCNILSDQAKPRSCGGSARRELKLPGKPMRYTAMRSHLASVGQSGPGEDRIVSKRFQATRDAVLVRGRK